MCVFAGLLITPDTLRDSLKEAIMSDLQSQVPFDIVWDQYWSIQTLEEVVAMYPNVLGRFSCPFILKTLLSGKSHFFLISSQDQGFYNRLREVKGSITIQDGKVTVTGLRYKYRSWHSRLDEALDSSKHEIMEKVFEFRLHITDDAQETKMLCHLCVHCTQRTQELNLPLAVQKILFSPTQ